MLDHISLRVVDYDKAVAFYKAALAPIGYELVMEFPGFAGLGEKGKPDLWITKTDKQTHATHVAFRADRSKVDAFHAAALAAGGADEGAPGPRTQYHPNYYSAFVLDPEGNNVEVVCHDPPGGVAGAAVEKLKAAGRRIKAAVSGKASKGAASKAASEAAAKAKAKVASVKQAAGKAAGKARGAAKAQVSKAAGAAKGKVAAVKKAAKGAAAKRGQNQKKK
jgi:catechol 2,3-dioxygenase-like lactoylglutathione lyase family enzyme